MMLGIHNDTGYSQWYWASKMILGIHNDQAGSWPQFQILVKCFNGMRDELVVYLEKVSVATAAAASEAGIVEVA